MVVQDCLTNASCVGPALNQDWPCIKTINCNSESPALRPATTN